MAFTCTVCKKEFEYPDWNCNKQPGHHTVESKIYYHTGARDNPDVRSRRAFAPVVILNPVYEYKDEATGKLVKTEGAQAQFYDGKFETNDPVLQYWLDRKGFPSGEEGLKEWEKIYLTPEQRSNIAEAKLAELDRKVKESESLLESVKHAKGVK